MDATGTVTNRSDTAALIFLSAEIESVSGLRTAVPVALYTPDGNPAGTELAPGEEVVYSVIGSAIAFQRFGEYVNDDQPAGVIIDASGSLWFADPSCGFEATVL